MNEAERAVERIWRTFERHGFKRSPADTPALAALIVDHACLSLEHLIGPTFRIRSSDSGADREEREDVGRRLGAWRERLLVDPTRPIFAGLHAPDNDATQEGG